MFYAPKSHRLVTWRLADRAKQTAGLGYSARLVAVRHDEPWSLSESVRALIEPAPNRGWMVRAALPPGRWDLAALVPGYGPAFWIDLKVTTQDPTPEIGTLEPAARLRAHVRETTSGKAPSKWGAYLDSLKPEDKSVVARFFAERPIDGNLTAIDFESLPIAGWQLRISSPDHATRVERVPPARAGEIVDLGNIFLTGFGGLQILISFPERVPPGFLSISIRRPTIESLNAIVSPAPLGRLVKATPETITEFKDLEPGLVIIGIENEATGLREEQELQLEADRIARLEVVLTPRYVSGLVYKKSDPVANADLTLSRGGSVKYNTKSKDDGSYKLEVWTPGHYFLMTALSSGRPPFSENVVIPDDARSVEHDVQLPSASISGTVRDSKTHSPIRAAMVSLQNTADSSDENAIHFQQRLPVDDGGRYVFDNLPDEALRLVFSASGYTSVTRSDLRPGISDIVLDIDLTKGATLTGVVLDGQGIGLGGAFVGVDTDGGGSNFARSTITDVQGGFSVDGVSEGTHTIVAFRCGYVMAVGSLDAKSGEASTPTSPLVLTPARERVSLRIQDSQGAPIVHAAIALAVNGVMLPIEYPSRFMLDCGGNAFSDGDGMIGTDLLPIGNLVAISPYTRRPLGSLAFDGTPSEWVIRAERAVVMGGGR